MRSPMSDKERQWDASGRVSDLPSMLPGCRTVIHCAAHVHRATETDEEKQTFQRINVDGTARLAEACMRAKVQQFVYLSTIAVYGEAIHRELPDEESNIRCKTFYAQSKYEGEQVVRNSSLDWRIVRIATVYGIGDRANFWKLAKAMKRGRFVLPGRGMARKSVIEIHELVDILSRLAVIEDPKYRLLNLANPNTPSLREICDAFAIECGFPRARSMPLPLLHFLASIGNLIGKFYAPCPLTTANLRKLNTNTCVDVHRMLEMFPDQQWCSFQERLRRSASYYMNL